MMHQDSLEPAAIRFTLERLYAKLLEFKGARKALKDW